MGRDDIEVGDEAVREATRRDWDGWRAWLDERNGPELTHREIVALLRGEGGVSSGWWQQMVTNGYEKLIGRRAVGETRGAGFQVGAQKTVGVTPSVAWAWAASPDGMRAWLGPGGVPDPVEGAAYELDDGSTGEIRVIEPGRRVRLTWHPPGWERSSTVQLTVTGHSDPAKCVVGFHQEHIPGPAEREECRARLKAGLSALAAAVEG